jgi:outer membrane protein assembly factor BamB
LFALDAASGATLWEHPMPSGVTSSTPAVSGGLVYIASGGDVASGRGFLLAVREGDGTLAWQAPMGSRGDSSPAVSGGTVFTTSDDGALHAYDATSGAEMWTASTGSFFFDSSPAVANGLLYVASGDSVIHAFDVATGLELWHDTLAQGYSDSIPSPVVVNGFLYIGSDDKWFAFSLPKRATS